MARTPHNYVVLRDSPDWLSYSDQQSRDFCTRFALPENTIIDFISLWDDALDVDYRQFRHIIKNAALANFRQVQDSVFLERADFRAVALEADDLIVFVDDDDWLAPDLFIRLRDALDSHDGAKWGSIRVGPVFSHLPETQKHGVFYARPIDQLLYTNNYAVTAHSLVRLRVEQLFEHRDAQKQLDIGAYRPKTVPQYLSAANKHPCSTMAALFFLSFEPFRRDPRAEISRFADTLARSSPEPNTPWIAEPVRKLRSLVEAAVGRTSDVARKRSIA
jgi:glycosyltransferase involved in cell wall biosynthesis